MDFPSGRRHPDASLLPFPWHRCPSLGIATQASSSLDAGVRERAGCNCTFTRARGDELAALTSPRAKAPDVAGAFVLRDRDSNRGKRLGGMPAKRPDLAPVLGFR